MIAGIISQKGPLSGVGFSHFGTLLNDFHESVGRKLMNFGADGATIGKRRTDD